jgi:hypothetical protein
MKKMVFFLLLLAFTRIGVALGMGTTPVGIGSFFLGSPSITESNLNQVLGLLVGPQGSPGVAGMSGENGINGVNGLNGAPGAPGSPGAQGLQGVAGPAGPAGEAGTGSGGVGTLGVGGGTVSIGTCDDTVNISATQTFQGDHFDLGTIVVSNIAGIVGASRGCAGQDATIHVATPSGAKSCTITLDAGITGANNSVTFTTASCGGVLSGIHMQDLSSNIGLEFTAHGGV